MVASDLFRRKKKEQRLSHIFYSRTGLFLLRLFCKVWSSLVVRLFNKSVQREE